MRLKYGKKKALTFSYDDCKSTDKKLVEIFDRYGLKGTFNINSGRLWEDETAESEKTNDVMRVSEAKELFKNSVHEVACHGVSHSCLEYLRKYDIVKELINDRHGLEKMFGGIIRGMAYPFGNYSEKIVSAAREAGILYSRTCQSTEYFDIPSDFLKFHPTCHHNYPKLMNLAEKFVNNTPAWGICWLFSVWGHSAEFEDKNNWNVIEDFAKYISCKDDIWYATNIEVFEYLSAFYSLVSSADNCTVYNPSGIDVWFEANEKVYKICPGETISI